MKLIFGLLLFSTTSLTLANAQSIRNLDQIHRQLGFDQIQVRPSRTVKIAILDKSLRAPKATERKTLLPRTTFHAGPVALPADLKSDHGLRMAQMVSGLLKRSEVTNAAELHLYNAYGFTNFKTAISNAIAQRADIILYSEVWEYGGNLDGRGFINAEVQRAIDAGILWVNAAGNFAKTNYVSAIQTGSEDWVLLPDNNNALKVICRAPSGKECAAKFVLSWNDFKDDSEAGTNKDLDFALTDDLLNVVQSSALKQTAAQGDASPGSSKYPREIISATLKAGTYFLRAKNRSKNFGSNDTLRITADGEFLEFPTAVPTESLAVPADHPDVLTVGASDADRSGSSIQLSKPEIMTASQVLLSDSNEFRGSSNSAAFVAAGAALLKLAGEPMDRESMIHRVKSFDWNRPLISIRNLGFGPTGQGCFIEGTWNEATPEVRRVLAMGGKLVATTQAWRIMTPFDPIELAPGLVRQRADDVVAITPDGIQVFRRFGTFFPPGTVELFPVTFEAGLCNKPSPSSGRSFNLSR